MQRTEKTIEINAPVERVFDLFSDFESFPRWMSHIREVRHTGRRYTRWTADAPLGSSVEWEAEITHFEPDQRIAWRSVRGDVDTEGEVVFQETSRGTTLVRVVLGYDPPAGRLGAMVARLFGSNPEQQLEEDLERFAEVAEERGGQRRARRSDLDDQRRFDEQRRRKTNATGRARRGPGAYDEELRERRGRAVRSDDERALRPRMDRGHDERGRYEDHSDRGYEPRDYVDERQRGRGRAPFERELSGARGGRRESPLRYEEERRSAERRRSRPERYERDADRPPLRDERPPFRDERGPADERRLYEGRRRAPAPRRNEDDRRASPPPPPPPPPPRHALTPREREMERRQRRFRSDSEYPEKAFRRGVDKLLDEDDAPSSRWRRW